MNRYPYTDIWRGRHVALERDTGGDLFITGDVVGARLPISHDEARILAAFLARETSQSKGRRFGRPWRRSQRQVAGDNSVQIMLGSRYEDRR